MAKLENRRSKLENMSSKLENNKSKLEKRTAKLEYGYIELVGARHRAFRGTFFVQRK